MDKEIKDLGTLEGKVLVFGGVYSNLQALEALILVAKEEQIASENCLCTGDILGYCAQPEEVVKTFRSWGAKSIIGNVEEQLKENAIDCGCDFKKGSRCDSFSKLWYPYTQRQLSEASIEYLKTLPNYITFSYKNKKIAMIHGGTHNISEFIFRSTSWKQKEVEFNKMGVDMILAGHCGLPFVDRKKDKIWINSGVIGMPANDATPRVWYTILDIAKEHIKITTKSLTYNYQLASDLMNTIGLPKSYATTLKTGLWNNMEILPIEEKKEQGIEIEEKVFWFK